MTISRGKWTWGHASCHATSIAAFQDQERSGAAPHAGGDVDLIARGERPAQELRARRERVRRQAGGFPAVLRRDPGPRRLLGSLERAAAGSPGEAGAVVSGASTA